MTDDLRVPAVAVFDDRQWPARSWSDGATVIDLREARTWDDAAGALMEGLRFPSPWGRNADAIEDGLRDLSWWPASELDLKVIVDSLRTDQRTIGLLVLLFSGIPASLKGRISVAIEISMTS